MIQFKCPGCGKPFALRDELAGRKARCKACGTAITVPEAAPAVARPSMRMRRLMADAQQVREALADFDLIKLKAVSGDPPEIYQVEYHVHGLAPAGHDPVPSDYHVVEITLGADYPRMAPQCKMLTPIFHPNIDQFTICVGDHWAAGERLLDLIVRIGEMISYQAYNIRSPLNAEAAMWADLHGEKLPTDSRDMHPPVIEEALN